MSEKKKPGVVDMIDASMDHLADADLKALDAVTHGWNAVEAFPRTLDHEQGYTLFLPGDEEGQTAAIRASYVLDCSLAFRQLLMYAFANKAYILNFDGDAAIIPGIRLGDEGCPLKEVRYA